MNRRRRLGQHFLTNPEHAKKIVHLAGVKPSDLVLEVGPGRGILTEPLLKACRHLIAVEADLKLAEDLADRFAAAKNFTLFRQDILKFPIEKELKKFSPHKAKVVANLPYSISTEIIFLLLEHRQCFSELYLMVQKEVADRLVATPGGKTYGILSVLTQLFSESQIVMKVSPGAFHPRPQVDSAVVAMRLSDTPRVAVNNVAAFKRLVRQAFATRRKMLRNCLKIADDDKWRGLCATIGIDPKARAEQVTLQQFAALSEALA